MVGVRETLVDVSIVVVTNNLEKFFIFYSSCKKHPVLCLIMTNDEKDEKSGDMRQGVEKIVMNDEYNIYKKYIILLFIIHHNNLLHIWILFVIASFQAQNPDYSSLNGVKTGYSSFIRHLFVIRWWTVQ